MAEFVTVAKVGAIPEGTGAAFPVGDKLVAVFNLGGGQYRRSTTCVRTWARRWPTGPSRTAS